MSRPLSRLLLAACFVLAGVPAFAQTQGQGGQAAQPPASDWTVSLGAGGLVAPDYEGSKDHEIKPLPFIDIRYRDVAFLNGREGLGVNVVNTPYFRFGPLLNYRFGRDQDDNSALRGMGNIDPALDAGAFAELRYNRLSLEVIGRQAISDTGLGGTISLVSGIEIVKLDDFTLSAGPSMTWASGDYMQTYFGVTPAQSVRSGLRSYSASSGIKDYGAGITAFYALSPNWGLASIFGVKKLMGDAADSPLVKDKGDSTQTSGGLFLNYRF